MKTHVMIVGTVLLMSFGFWACEDDPGPTQGQGELSGTVTDGTTGAPISAVTIVAQTVAAGSQNTVTDAEGNYQFTFDLDSASSVSVGLTKSGFRDTSVTAQIHAGSVTPLNVRMTPRSVVGGGGTGGSGYAQTITFMGSNPGEVSVYGVGGQETSILSFEVRDSLGLPIDAAHAVVLTFTPVNGPGGGEYISPVQVTTNATGRAYTTFNAGIRSGVVQVLASTSVNGRTISTSPIRLVINAGFPDQAHFTVAAENFNFPTLGVAGNRDEIAVIVGDMYSNPVVRNTAVYFRTWAGVIQASVFTSEDGEGIAELISGNPAPFGIYADPDSGNAYHWVVARTIGQGGVTIQDSVRILWSGAAVTPVVTPDTFSIPNGGYRDFELIVSDGLGHPLAAGTAISAVATVPPPPDPNAPVNQVQLSFGQNGLITLNEVIGRGPGSTVFGFRLSDGSTVNQYTPVSISITVTGPNGSAYRTINGIVY